MDHRLMDQELAYIAKCTEHYSNSDLKELVREAAYVPLRQLQETELKKLKKIRPIILDDFMQALKKIRGTLTDDLIEEYVKWNDEFGEIIYN